MTNETSQAEESVVDGSLPSAADGADEEIGTTIPSARTASSVREASLSTRSRKVLPGGGGKDLLWSGVSMKLLDPKTGDVKLNILKVRTLSVVYCFLAFVIDMLTTWKRHVSIVFSTAWFMQDVWGKAEAGKTTAIMGASGAGSKLAIPFVLASYWLCYTVYQVLT